MGNRAQKTDSAAGATGYTVDAANRLTGIGSQAVTSDANGNTLSDGTRTNTWDSQNRLVSCTSGGVTSTYTYGADGLRRTSTVNGVTTYYVYDGTTLVREMRQNAQGVLQPTATYLCGPRGPEYRRDDTQAEGTYSDSTGTHPAGRTRWYVYDGLGSVVGEVDPSGNLTSSGKYDVYGAKRQGGTGTATSRQGFVGSCGHVTDDTGLVYMRARYYDPQMGRFVSEDPAKNGMNWFAYCDNNPINEADFDGRYGKNLTAVIGMIKNDVAYDLGIIFGASCVMLFAAGNANLAASSAALVLGLAATASFAVAFGADDLGALKALLTSATWAGMAMSIMQGASAGERVGAGAGSLAMTAIVGCAVYGFMVLGALAGDEVGI